MKNTSAFNNYTTLGKIATIGLIGFGIYFAAKNYKKEGFFVGAASLLLISSAVVLIKPSVKLVK